MRIKAKDVKKAALKTGEVTLYAGLWVLCAAVDVAVGAVKLVAEVVADSKRFEREMETKREKDLSLTCRMCGGLSRPIGGTSNRYRCSCGRQFKGARHNL